MKCPFSCSQHGTMPDCARERCVMADGAGDCFIKQALQLYVGGERSKRAEEEERSRKEMQQALAYWESLKEKNARIATPIQYAHQLIDKDHPHGGMYEDLSSLSWND